MCFQKLFRRLLQIIVNLLVADSVHYLGTQILKLPSLPPQWSVCIHLLRYFSFSIAYCFTLPVVLYSYLDLCKGHVWALSSSNALANFKSNTDMPLIQIYIMTSRRSNSSLLL